MVTCEGISAEASDVAGAEAGEVELGFWSDEAIGEGKDGDGSEEEG